MIRTETAGRPTAWLTMALAAAVLPAFLATPAVADDPGDEPVAEAAPDGDELDRAIKELQGILNVKPEGAAAQQLQRDLNLTRNFMRQLDQYLARQDYDNILRQIPNWVRNMQTPEVRKVWLGVSVALRKRMQARDRGIITSVGESPRSTVGSCGSSYGYWSTSASGRRARRPAARRPTGDR